MKENIAAYILCGGKSSRMGTEKGLVTYEGKPFVEHIIEAVLPLTEKVFLVTENSDYEQFGHPLIKDIHKDKGPLGGIHSALSHSESDTNILLSCDIPLIITAVLSEVLSDHQKGNHNITVAATKNDMHPLIGVYSKGLLPSLDKHIAENKLKLTDFVEESDHQLVIFDDLDALSDINSKKELKNIHSGLLEVNLKYFGQIAEITGKTEEKFRIAAPNVSQLLRDLKDTYNFSETPLNIAVNKEIVHATDDRELKNTDDIAILPPFAGG